MNVSHSDALGFFGATGDLAYKKIFPALHAMAKRGQLRCLVRLWSNWPRDCTMQVKKFRPLAGGIIRPWKDRRFGED